ncbi:MAG: hypothetical protein KBD16_00645 [Candidatus Pacebacteria bacterium]|nr:hypothetical protein [Candidatus Paceibacterota bacterium]
MKKTHAKSLKTDDTNVTVSLSLGTTTIQGTGPSVLAALKALEKPIKITTKSVITVSKGTKSHSRPLTIPLAQRLFYPAAQIYQAKNFELLLK